MKRLLIVLSVFLLLVSFTGCIEQKSENQVTLYYRTQKIDHGNKEGVIAPELRYFADRKNLTDVLTEYFSGPVSETLASPFPFDLSVRNLTIDSSQVNLVLSDHIAALTGIDLTVTCVCIQKTISAYTGINTVYLSAENEKINNQDFIILKSSDVILFDEEVKNPTISNDAS